MVFAAIGLYGLLAYTVARRINEIGVRMAVGATASSITRMVLRDGLGMMVVGLAMGVSMVIWIRPLAARPGRGSSRPEPESDRARHGSGYWVALFVSSIPARRAARVDPIEALRHD
jgi:putative ABC transport system permease protein